MSLFTGFTTSTILPKRRIGSFNIDIVMEETIEDRKTVTKNPIDRGANVNDHFFLESPTVTINFVVGSTSGVPIPALYNAILELYKTSDPFDLVTKNRIFSDVYIENLISRSDANSFSVLVLTATLMQYNFVTLEFTSVPERSKQADAAATGRTEQVGTKKPSLVSDDKTGITTKEVKKGSILIGLTDAAGFTRDESLFSGDKSLTDARGL